EQARPWKLELVKLKSRTSASGRYVKPKGTFRASNQAGERAKARLCVRLYDADGAEVENGGGETANLAPAKSDTVTFDGFVCIKDWSQTATLKAYLARFGCTDSVSEAVSNVVTIDRKN